MRLYLARHGTAASKEADPERPLTARGHQAVSRLAQRLSQNGVRVKHVIHSGKLRAVQTAAILGELIAPGVVAAGHEHLKPLDPPEILAAETGQWRDDTLVVGHLPFIALLVALLVTGTNTPVVTRFTPGTVICLERDDNGQWCINWMLRPELLQP